MRKNRETGEKFRKSKTAALSLVFAMLHGFTVPVSTVQGQARNPAAIQGLGRTVRSFRTKPGGNRPASVEGPLRRSLAHFNEHKEKFGLQEPEADLRLLAAEEDDRGFTQIRFGQLHNGVPVFGGQLVSQVNADSVRDVSGRVFEAQIETTPFLDPEQAIEAAKHALGHAGELARPPKAKLFVLPHRIFNNEETGATLVYQVGLRIMDPTTGPAHGASVIDCWWLVLNPLLQRHFAIDFELAGSCGAKI